MAQEMAEEWKEKISRERKKWMKREKNNERKKKIYFKCERMF